MYIRNYDDCVIEIAEKLRDLHIEDYRWRVDIYLNLDTWCDGSIFMIANPDGILDLGDGSVMIDIYRPPVNDCVPDEDREDWYSDRMDDFIERAKKSLDKYVDGYSQVYQDHDNNELFVPESEVGSGMYKGSMYRIRDDKVEYVRTAWKSVNELKKYDDVTIIHNEFFPILAR